MSDPATERGWADAMEAATRRMRRALGKIDHVRRMELIEKKVYGLNMTREERDELEALQQACDDAMREHDELRIRYNRWQVVQVGGAALLERLDRMGEEGPGDAQE